MMMAMGSIGGPVTELVLTCMTPAAGEVALSKGDAVALTGNYEIDHADSADDPIFGQVLADAAGNSQSVPVKVRGVCVFSYTGSAPPVDGESGVTASATAGAVQAPAEGSGVGIVLSVDEAKDEVQVLI